MGQVATLAGFDLAGFVDHPWTFKHGTEPHVQTFEVHVNIGPKILEAGRAGPVELRVKSDDREVLVVKHLYVTHLMPTEDPYKVGVQVVDKRWLWQRRHCVRRFNLRRRTGTVRWLDGAMVELPEVADDVQYIPASLKHGTTPWNGVEILQHIMADLGEKEYSLPTTINDRLKSIENLEIDDRGDIALARVMSEIPGLSVWIDKDGNVIFEDQIGGDENQVLAQVGRARVRGGGALIDQNNALLRPKNIHVYFTREIEVRFDHNTAGTWTRDGRFMDMVLELPDIKLTINGRDYALGSWVNIDTNLFEAWGEGPVGLPKLTEEFIRDSWVWGLLELTYGQLGEYDPNVNWQHRVAAIHAHYRQSFKINRRWVDRSLSIKPWRVTLLDPATGVFAMSPVFVDYAVMPSTRGMLHDPDKASYMYNVVCYDEKTERCRRAPARLNVVDQQVGILRFQWADHPLGWVDKYIVSAVDNIPTADPTSPLNRADKEGVGRLSETFKAATIVTMVPGWPNDLRQLHKVTIKSQDIVGPNVECLGPDMEVRVPTQFTARIGWTDDKAQDIEEAFGVGVVDNAAIDPDNLSLRLKSNLANPEEVDAISRAIATAVLTPLRDRVVGQLTEQLTPGLRPAGAITEVTHTLSQRGEALTTISIAPELPPVDWFSYLPEEVRRVILRQVQV